MNREVAKMSRSDAWPEEKPAHITGRSLVFTLIGTLVVVIFLNFLVGWYLEDHTFNRGYWLITQKSKLLCSLRKPNQWLILGDSSGNMGIVPEILDRELGVSSVNLCTIADMLTMEDLFMLQTYIRRCGRPAGVLLVNTYNAWPRKGKVGALGQSQWPLWQIKDRLDMSISEFCRMLVARYLPLYSESTTITNMSLMPRTALMAFLRNGPFELQPDGYMAVENPVPAGVLRDARLHLAQISEVQPAISRPNLQALEDISRLAQQHGFKVYIISSPLYEELWRDRKFRRYFDKIQDKLRCVAEGLPGLVFLNFGPDLTFRAEQMENVDHVIYSAAKVYTARLASRIKSAGAESSRHSKILASAVTVKSNFP